MSTPSTPEMRDEFLAASKPLMEFMSRYYHPHVTVIVTPTNALLMEGLIGTGLIMDFVKD